MGQSRYSPEFRAEAMRLVVEYARPVADVAREVGVHDRTLRTWLSRAKKERMLLNETGDESLEDEVVRLRSENADQKKLLRLKEQENEFLKKAALDSIHRRNKVLQLTGWGLVVESFAWPVV